MKVFSTKNMIVGGLLALTIALTGCLTDDKKDAAAGPSLTTSLAGTTTVAFGDSINLTVAATGTGTVTYKWFITEVSGKVDTLSDSIGTIKGKVPASVNGATIKCVVTDSKGSTSSSTVVTVTGLAAWPSASSLTVGAQANSALGSVIDLDSGKVWTSTVANANQSKIDLVFMYYTNAFHLDGAVAAKTAGVANSINLTNSYSDAQIKDIMMLSVSSKPSSQQAAKEAYDDAGSALVRTSVIVGGEKFIVKTTEGKYVYIETTATASGTSATCASGGAVATTCATESVSVSMSTL